jgi:hypothetical protein
MIHSLLSRRRMSPSVALLAAAMMAGPMTAAAQQDVTTAAPAVNAATVERSAFETPLPVRLQVGDATGNLLRAQREGSVASPTPRPLAGDVASLSYQRYLDSFKYAIPEKFSTTVQRSGSSGSSR